MKKLLFIVNPRSGQEKIRQRILAITEIFSAGGYLVTLYPTGGRQDATKIVQKRAKSFDMIVCAGGDGTLDEVVTGLMLSGHRTPVGYIPCGSTNDYARSLKIPVDPLKAAELILTGVPTELDVGKFGDSYFIYVAAFGAFTEVSYSTSQFKKNVMGHLAYVLDGAMSLGNIIGYPMKISYDTGELDGRFIYGMMSNSISVGGFKSPGSENVVLNDGIFEMLIVREPANPAEFSQMIAALLSNNLKTDYVQFIQTRKAVFETPIAIPWALDGEFGGSHVEVTAENMNRAVTIITNLENREGLSNA